MSVVTEFNGRATPSEPAAGADGTQGEDVPVRRPDPVH
ncbi:MAG: hypothetical protein QOC75_3620, partial [Pseudonocardiales bacterium]|nr:hypothetical protein [Pseudonocardiales bacterium]